MCFELPSNISTNGNDSQDSRIYPRINNQKVSHYTARTDETVWLPKHKAGVLSGFHQQNEGNTVGKQNTEQKHKTQLTT